MGLHESLSPLIADNFDSIDRKLNEIICMMTTKLSAQLNESSESVITSSVIEFINNNNRS